MKITEAMAVTKQTPKGILLGAGIYAHGITFDAATGVVSDVGTLLGCTQGGGKFSIKPNLHPLELDQSTVARKDAYVKLGETATIETNLTEVKAEDVENLVMGTSWDGTNAKVVTSSETVQEGSYYENFGFIGFTAANQMVAIIFDYAICTSGFELNPKKAEQGAATLTFECVAELDSGENKLPYTIIWPTATDAAAVGEEEETE